MRDGFVPKCVTIGKDQEEFLKEEKERGKKFNLSKFTQVKLDEYIKTRKEYRQFMEVE